MRGAATFGEGQSGAGRAVGAHHFSSTTTANTMPACTLSERQVLLQPSALTPPSKKSYLLGVRHKLLQLLLHLLLLLRPAASLLLLLLLRLLLTPLLLLLRLLLLPRLQLCA